MYTLSDEEIEYILSDIRRSGVETEDLQLNLLDHICCIIEQNLEATGDFGHFYRQTIKQFYKKELREIEEETTLLLTFKNYYTMKKSMTVSGSFSAIAFCVGSLFKIMAWPGANVLFVSAVVVFSFVFLPLLFLLKTKEADNSRDKLLLIVATAVGILYSMSILFQVQHWNGRRELLFATFGLSFLILIPLYFFSGIRKAETKVNTIISTVLLLGFLGLQFLLVGLRPRTPKDMIYGYLQNEQLLQKLEGGQAPNDALVQDIQKTCEEMKTLILQTDAGLSAIPQDFEARNIPVPEFGPEKSVFVSTTKGRQLLDKLRTSAASYNALKANKPETQLPVAKTILDPAFMHNSFCSNIFVLNNITQLQLFLATNENKAIASN